MERVARHVVCLTHDANYVRIERLAFNKRDDSCGHAGRLVMPRSIHVSDDVEPKPCATPQDGEAQYRPSDYFRRHRHGRVHDDPSKCTASGRIMLFRIESAGLRIKASTRRAFQNQIVPTVFAVRAHETKLGSSRREDFWFIVAARSEDETEIRAGQSSGRTSSEEHSASDTPAVLG